MSTAGSVALPPPASKTSAAPLSSCAFHWVIWFGCTSNCSASCTIVRSPLIAATATLALNAGEWFRRGRLFIVAPDSPTLACPLSGRNSTYRPVKNFGAGSEPVERAKSLVMTDEGLEKAEQLFRKFQTNP